ncbi:MAG TPA: alcohol dehydrogenase catalytic domain-containing protein [Solirubrobacteraceae bacterium]|nr:alcohol dehydrogenase catalytic domain-containing protein [Solirubrobacteraceae bacterium]
MKAAVFQGIRQLSVEEVETPRAGADGVVLSVAACGICGSDLHTYLHGSFVAPGQVMGHEFVGTVVEAGPEVQGISVGDRITASPLQPCHECPRCAEGRYNLCAKAWTQGIAYGKPGAFAELVRIPQATIGQNVFALDPDMADEAGAMVEPLAVAVHAVRLAAPVQGTTAVVTGLGTIGQQVVQTLRAYGAGRVIGVDVSELRLGAARELGAEVLDGRAELGESLRELLGADGEVDVIFECTGVPAVATTILEQVRAGGTIVVLALYDDPITFNPTALVQKEIRLQGSIAYTESDFAEAVSLLGDGRVKVGPLVTHVLGLDDIGQAFEVQLEKDRSLKVLVTPDGH